MSDDISSHTLMIQPQTIGRSTLLSLPLFVYVFSPLIIQSDQQRHSLSLNGLLMDRHIKRLQEQGHPTWDDDEISVGPTEQRFGVVGLVITEHIQDKHAPLSGETAIWPTTTDRAHTVLDQSVKIVC